jgi:YYY domain-containing protein
MASGTSPAPTEAPESPSRRGVTARTGVMLLLILVAASWFRLAGVNWDQGKHLHPDERFLTMVAADIQSPPSIAGYFETARSPLNPANVGRPFFVYGTLPLFLVRAVAETIGLTGYDQICLVGRVLSALFDITTVALTFWLGLLLAGPRVAVAASALVAFSVISVQQAHFFTVDSAATCMTTLALVMLVRVVAHHSYTRHMLFGIAFGLALSCRVNLALLGLLYAVALLHLYYVGRLRIAAITTAGVAASLATLIAFRLFQPYAFAGPGFFGLALAQDFLQSASTIRALVTGAVDYPPSVQWIGRVPILSAGSNLVLWGLGPVWGLAAIAGLVWGLRRRAAHEGERLAAGRIVLLWAPLLFVFHAMQFAATLRYFLPIVPVLAVAAAWCLGGAGTSRTRNWLLAIVVGTTACWCVAFSSIYQRPHTRVAASTWIYNNVAPGSTIAVEHWDDALPLAIESRVPSIYTLAELKLYDEENEGKRRQLLAALDAADVIVLSSNRLYGSIPRAPWRYPLSRRYYELLFGHQLGFQLERVFTSYPRIASLEVPDDAAEEAFTVYDHPKVVVFRKTSAYSLDRVTQLLNDVSFANIVRVPPRDASALYRRMRPSPLQIQGEAGARDPVAASPMDSWGALARWLIGLEVLSLAWFALLFGPLAGSRDRGYGLAKLVAWAGCGWIVWLLSSTGLASHTRELSRGVAGLVLIAGLAAAWRRRSELARFCRDNRRALLSVEAVFLVTFAVFLSIRSLNPAIFWGEKPMDFAIFNASLRATAMPPADPWFAGESLNYFYVGQALAAFFSEIAGVPAAFAFNLAMATVAGLLATAVFLFGYQLSARLAVGWIASAAVVFVGNLAGPRLLFESPSRAFDFNYFWATSRVVQGTINEFPFWSFVFADLHAHVLAMPFEAALLYAGAIWITSAPSAGWLGTLFLAAVTAWLGGTVAVTSSWSVPTIVALQLGLLTTAWVQQGATLRGLVRSSLLAAGMLGLAYVLFLPFWSRYAPPPKQWGWVREEYAPLGDVLTIFGVFLVAALPMLVRTIRQWCGHRLLPLAGVAIGIAIVAIVGWLRSPACALYLTLAFVAAVAWATAASAPVRTGALLVAAAGAIGAATEAVFVWDRMNTVFKFYLHVWLLLACGSSVLVWTAVQQARYRLAHGVPLLAVVAAGVFTSVTGAIGYVRSPHAISPTPTLDGMAYLESANPSERAAYEWVGREIPGIPVVLEAQGPSYQAFSRVSMNTGLPTLLGWEYHLFQQGRSRDDIAARARDVREIYTSDDTTRVEALLRNYNIDFIFVGQLEQQTYGSSVVERFTNSTFVEPVFKNGPVTILASPGRASTVKTWIEKTAPPLPLIDPLSPLSEPRGIARAPDGTLVVADFGNRRVQRLGPDARPLGAFGVVGEGPGQFRDPAGVAVAGDGRIWVADTWNHRVQAFTPEGRQVAEWHAGLYGPRGIALAADGVVYLTDTGNGRVLKFAPDGTFEVVMDKTVLDHPVGIAIDRRGQIYVADTGHRRIVVLSAGGEMVREWAIDGWQSSQRMEPYLAIGPDDVVWVTDPPNRRVLLFSSEGTALGTAAADAPLELPLGITVVDRTTALVTDGARNAVIQIRRPEQLGNRPPAPRR